ncbi:hypothetical protein B0H11DRAFT_2286251 [Mycena galericulata]|nr:hypothetical protein B0H11DRAFT_2286251 [Mycena galericulata]
MSRKILPAMAAFAVLTIDPVASLDAETQEDAEAVAACKKMVNKQYVGFVRKRMGLYQPWAPHNACRVEFLLQGEPEDSPDRGIDPSMSIPILPMTKEAHPSSRIPLKPSNPLPWDDCYLSVFWSFRVRKLLEHSKFLRADLARHEALYGAEGPTVEPSPDYDEVASTGDPNPYHATQSSLSVAQEGLGLVHEGHDNTPRAFHFHSHSSTTASLNTAEDDGGDLDPAGEPFLPFFSNAARHQMITVNFTHDLSTVKELNHPSGFFKEVEVIVRIQQEAWPRNAEAKRQK